MNTLDGALRYPSNVDEDETIRAYGRFGRIISSFDRIIKLDKRSSMKRLLNDVLQLVPEAEKGSFYELRGDIYRPVASVGYDPEVLSKLEIDKSDFLYQGCMTVQHDAPVMHTVVSVRNLNKYDEDTIALYKKLGTYRDFQVLYAPIVTEGEVEGCIFLDNFSEKCFSSLSIKTLKYYAQLVSSYYSQQKQQRNIMKIHMETVAALVASIEVNDTYTEGHGKRVSFYAKRIAEALQMPEDGVREITTAGLLHDIGKIGIPSEIVNKKTKLSSSEYDLLKKHPENTSKILMKVEGLRRVREFTLHHHERFDGTGYPAGLIGNAIPFESQILAVADAFDAMTSNRAYRDALSLDFALREIAIQSGRQFNPYLVSQVTSVLREAFMILDSQRNQDQSLNVMDFMPSICE